MFYEARDRADLSIVSEDASAGAPLTFWDSLRRSYDYDNLVESQWGAANDLITQEQEMFQRIRKAGGKPPDSAYLKGDATGYFNLTRAEKLARAVRDQDRRTYDDMVSGQDEELRRLQQQYPDAGIKTYGDMYRDTIDRRKKLEALDQRGRTWTGFAGSLAGSMGAGFNFATNPLGVLATPIGGLGKGIATRVLTESLAQGAVQAVEEVTGVRENKRLLGLEPSWTESAANVGAAAAFGGAFQIGGEGLRVGAKTIRGKWFKNAENDPAPPPPPPQPVAPPAAATPPAGPPAAPAPGTPLAVAPVARRAIDPDVEARIMRAVQDVAGSSKNMRRAAMADSNHMVTQLDRFDVAVADIAPPMHTRPFVRPGDPQSPRVVASSPGETVDQIARRIDPETFRQYDKLAAEIGEQRSKLQQALNMRNIGDREALQTFDDAIEVETRKLAGANKRKSKIYEDRIAKLREERASEEARLLALDDNTSALYRRSITMRDEKMRDLAPAVSRAYARARGKWENYDATRAQIERMMERGETKLPDTPDPDQKIIDAAEAEYEARGQTSVIADMMPELNTAAKKAGEDAMDVAKRVNDEIAKVADKALDEMRALLPKLIKREGDEAVIFVEGYGEVPLSRELKEVDADGNERTVTVKQKLEEMIEDEEALGALLTCSVGTTSATA